MSGIKNIYSKSRKISPEEQGAHLIRDDGTRHEWNSLTEVQVWTTGGRGTGPATGQDSGDRRTGDTPSDALDLSNWKLTLPIGAEGKPTEVRQPDLKNYSNDPLFLRAGRAIRFRAPVTGVTTAHSKYPRTELREMTGNGAENASWSSSSGTHTLTVSEAFTKVPNDKPHVVGAQIHDSSDDVSVFRLEGSSLYITDGGNAHHKLITSDYKLGTRFEAKFVVSGGTVKAYYNGVLQTTLAKDFSGAYFKAGAYTQANCEKSSPCDASNVGEVLIYAITVNHT